MKLVAKVALFFVCAYISGILGWLLLFAGFSGNLWAWAGLIFGITTAAVVAVFMADITSFDQQPQKERSTE